MNVLLFAPQYRPNMSSMIRSAEFYGFKTIYIYDRNDLLKPPTNKKGKSDMAHMAKVWTAGAVDYIDIEIVKDPVQFLNDYEGRKIGTLIDETAQHLNDFKFESTDLILFGSERDGLSDDAIALLDDKVYIPQVGHTNCLNVAVTFGIVVHTALANL